METDARTKLNLYGLLAGVHKIVTDCTAEYFQRYRKAVYCTPKSYLSFLDLYRDIYSARGPAALAGKLWPRFDRLAGKSLCVC